MTEIEEFYDKHFNPSGGLVKSQGDEILAWAKENCPNGTMKELWDNAPSKILCMVALAGDVLTKNQKRKLWVWRAKVVSHLLDPKSIEAVEAADRYANGIASESELEEARVMAHKAAYEKQVELDVAILAKECCYKDEGLTMSYFNMSRQHSQCPPNLDPESDSAESKKQAEYIRLELEPNWTA